MNTEVLKQVDDVRTRRSLVDRLRDLEDRDSWQDFFDTYWKLIFSVARKAGLTETEAEEVVQETTITVANCIEEYRYDHKLCSFKSWLLHKTRWRIIDQVRKRQPPVVERFATRTEGNTPLIERIPDADSLELESVWNEEWHKNLIEAAMHRVKHRVNPLHFQVFYLAVVSKIRPAKVAKSLNVNVARVYLIKHRVGRMIQREIRLLENSDF